MNIYRRLSQIKKRARRKNLSFNLDTAWMRSKLEEGKCAVTGIPFSEDISSPFYPSVDRIDSSKGYTKDNCQLVILIYNLAKSNFDVGVVTIWAKEFIKKYEIHNRTLLGISRQYPPY